MTVSYERAGMLMSIIKLAAELGPRDANSVSAMAMAELKAMDDEARKELQARAAATKAEVEAAAAAFPPAEETEEEVEPAPKPAPSIPRRS